jgi:hypothetical protein
VNNYARLSHVKAAVNATGSTASDEDILRATEQASAACRTHTGRQFHSTTETRVFEGGCSRLWVGDLLSVTSVKSDDDDDETYGTTYTVSTEYRLWPRSPGTNKPYRAIDLMEEVFPSVQVQVVGKWGYSEITEAVVIGGAAVTGTLTSAGDLSLVTSVSTEGVLDAGDTLFMGTEQLEVLDVSSTTITVTRGINGTTAATQTAVALYLRRFPPDIERAVATDAARYLWRYSQGLPEGSFGEMWPAISGTLNSYTDAGGYV